MSKKLKSFILDRILTIIIYILVLFFVFKGNNGIEQAIVVVFGILSIGSGYLEYKGAYLKSFLLDKFLMGVIYIVVMHLAFLQGEKILFGAGIIIGILVIVSSYFEYKKIAQ